MAGVFPDAAVARVIAAVGALAPLPPGVLTGQPASIRFDSAVVKGSVNPNGAPTTYSFEYGRSAAYGQATARADAGSGSEPLAVSAKLTGLAPGALYHYRLVAANAFGQAAGEDASFRTPDLLLRGLYAVKLRILRGGRPFGQRAGQVVRRRYRFSPRCRQRLCPVVALRREAASGAFRSRLRRRGPGRYSGIERSRGVCSNGERFRASARLSIHATALSGRRISRISGRLVVQARGCARATETARLEGRLLRR